MQDLRREGCGAILTERCNSLVDLRSRGTVTGNPYIVAGPRGGRGTLFDGTDDKVSIPCNRSMNSFEAWVYFESITEEVADFDGGTHYLKATAGTLAATGWATPTIYVDGVATTTVTTGWHHIAVTTGTAFTCTNLQLGTDNTGFGSVRIADVSLWGRALTAAEVLQEYNGTTWDYDLSEVTRWDMSENNPQDVGWKNSGNHGTGTNIAASDIVDGPYGGKALKVASNPEGVTVVPGPSITGLTSFSISVLAKADSAAHGGNLGVLWDLEHVDAADSTGQIMLYFGGSGGLNQIYWQTFSIASGFAIGTGYILPAETPWYLITGTYDAPTTTARLYLDGVERGTADISSAIDLSTATAQYFGYRGGGQLVGKLADARLHSAALTQMQIADLYARLTGGRA